jgi:hypothetical protein
VAIPYEPAGGVGADVGDRQTAELAEKLRTLAQTDPVLARALVAELVTALNRATSGAFGRHLSPAARDALGITDDAPLDGLEAAWAASAAAADADRQIAEKPNHPQEIYEP